MTIIDGKRREFDSGALRSDAEGRGRFDLISPYALLRLAIQYETGGLQKGDRNWEQGFPISRACSSAIRHITQQLSGDRREDHYAAASWQMFCAMHFEVLIGQGRLDPKWNDLPIRPPLGLLDVIATTQVNIPRDTNITASMPVYQAIMRGHMHGEIIKKHDRFILQCKKEVASES